MWYIVNMIRNLLITDYLWDVLQSRSSCNFINSRIALWVHRNNWTQARVGYSYVWYVRTKRHSFWETWARSYKCMFYQNWKKYDSLRSQLNLRNFKKTWSNYLTYSTWTREPVRFHASVCSLIKLEAFTTLQLK